MGLSESKLTPVTVKSIIRHESIAPLPSFSMDTAKFSDGSSGFVITTVDLAKNSESYSIPIKMVYSPYDNCIVYIGADESTLSFVKDRISGKVVCSFMSIRRESVVRYCVTTYEPLDDKEIDKIGEIFSKNI